jgi:hypothetical protein
LGLSLTIPQCRKLYEHEIAPAHEVRPASWRSYLSIGADYFTVRETGKVATVVPEVAVTVME